MTLDEHIHKAEEDAKMAEFDTEWGIGNYFVDRTEALEYAKECRQLAEWLKDYKRLLEQEPNYNSIKTELEPCDDAISRQAVLDAIDTYDKFGYTETGCFVREPKGDYVPYIYFDDAIKCIRNAPSVTPQPKIEPCEDMVSRDAMWDVLQRLYGTEGELVEELMSLPPVLPQPKMGHWEWVQYDGNPNIGNWHCSECHSIGRSYFDYCPFCGAKMQEVEK